MFVGVQFPSVDFVPLCMAIKVQNGQQLRT